ncbi:DUF2304 domain-containing protein [Vibrio kyushuensis]|uniref:DUF2304 domain-containing protein n=1 Tax=Vibrio kyushuensis TaxID=2910249 RepID=UPI003D11CC8D
MIIKLLLVTVLLIFIVYSFQQRKLSYFVSVLLGLFSILGIIFVADPQSLSYIANLIGVGRGADLLLYVYVVVGAIILFNLHLKYRSLFDKYTKLIRHIALLESEIDRNNETYKN